MGVGATLIPDEAVEIRNQSNASRTIDAKKFSDCSGKFNEVFRLATPADRKLMRYEIRGHVSKDVFTSLCDFANGQPFSLVSLGDAGLEALRAIAQEHRIASLIDRCEAYRRNWGLPRPVLITSQGNPDFCIAVADGAPLACSLVLSRKQPDWVSKLFVLHHATRQILSCASGLALQIEWFHTAWFLFWGMDWVIGQGVPDARKLQQCWRFEIDGEIMNDRFDPRGRRVFDIAGGEYKEGQQIQAHVPSGSPGSDGSFKNRRSLLTRTCCLRPSAKSWQEM
jgi:hypothetical protein